LSYYSHPNCHQSIAKSSPIDVGTYSLQVILDVLREHGGSEEYLEALELISKLVRSKDKDASVANTILILHDKMNIELLLDLLEHEDGLVAVMASEILSYIHTNQRLKLESTIQDCPAGMNKLLACIPDRSREEVSNQAIILISQLTENNEDMKKTVAFNEVIHANICYINMISLMMMGYVHAYIYTYIHLYIGL
jgi:hypothetical protein